MAIIDESGLRMDVIYLVRDRVGNINAMQDILSASICTMHSTVFGSVEPLHPSPLARLSYRWDDSEICKKSNQSQQKISMPSCG